MQNSNDPAEASSAMNIKVIGIYSGLYSHPAVLDAD